eukprot:scaffold7551_cov123-Isochrysis_galbana.AAC.16
MLQTVCSFRRVVTLLVGATGSSPLAHAPTHDRARAGGGDPGTAAVPQSQSGMRHGGWAARAPVQP